MLSDLLDLLADYINLVVENFQAEMIPTQTESIGWLPLDKAAYLHIGSDEPVIKVVGIAKAEMAVSNVLWLL